MQPDSEMSLDLSTIGKGSLALQRCSESRTCWACSFWSWFVNCSCEPNLINYEVLVESMDCQLAHIGFFAKRDVSSSQQTCRLRYHVSFGWYCNMNLLFSGLINFGSCIVIRLQSARSLHMTIGINCFLERAAPVIVGPQTVVVGFTDQNNSSFRFDSHVLEQNNRWKRSSFVGYLWS